MVFHKKIRERFGERVEKAKERAREVQKFGRAKTTSLVKEIEKRTAVTQQLREAAKPKPLPPRRPAGEGFRRALKGVQTVARGFGSGNRRPIPQRFRKRFPVGRVRFARPPALRRVAPRPRRRRRRAPIESDGFEDMFGGGF